MPGKRLITLAALLLGGGVAHAADQPVSLTKPPPLHEDVDAAPKIQRPRTGPERRINKALAGYDARSLKELEECRKSALENARVIHPADTDFEWRRSIKPSMRGPHYLSFSVFTYYSCGGAHPSPVTSSIIFDLETGLRAQWKNLLPKKLVGKTDENGAGGIEMPSMASKRLHELYVQAYRKGEHADDKQCVDSVESSDSEPMFQAWLDAGAGGLTYVMLLNQFDTACMDEFVLPLETLRAEGAPEATLRALDLAHKTWIADKPPK